MSAVLTVEAFLEWEERQPARFEFDGVALTPEQAVPPIIPECSAI
jgi:hypothetical protein